MNVNLLSNFLLKLQDQDELAFKELQGLLARFEALKGDFSVLDAYLQRNPPKDGETGSTGPQGERGEQGVPGTDGIDGEDGAQGKTGPRGSAGMSGVDGKPGKDGKDGRDGIEITAQEVKKKLESLLADDRLDISALKGYEPSGDIEKRIIGKVEKQIIYPNRKLIDQRWHGAGVTRIIAGSGVSISSTGSDGLGDVTINASDQPADIIPPILMLAGM